MWAERQRNGVVSAYESPDPPCPARRRMARQQLHLTQCINQMVFESQLPNKTVKLLFTLSFLYNKLMILWGS